MLNALRRKYIVIAMTSLAAVLAFLLILLNTVAGYAINNRYNGYLSLIADNGGTFPQTSDINHLKAIVIEKARGNSNALVQEAEKEKSAGSFNSLLPQSLFSFFNATISEETHAQVRYFTVLVTAEGNIVCNTGNVSAVDDEKAMEYKELVSIKNDTRGLIDHYKYQVIQTKRGGTMYIFLDWQIGINELKSYFLLMFAFCLLLWLMVLLPVTFLTGRMVKPIEDSIRSQKRFVTDAGHELKTPVAIISADTEMLELEMGESEWTKSIDHQLKRLTDLIQNMLLLAKLDEQYKETVWEPTAFGSLVMEYVEQFTNSAAQKGLCFVCDVNEEAILYGNETRLEQIVTILLDNAVKYAEGDEISVACDVKDEVLHFSVSNVCSSLTKEDVDHLFDRFYRPDASRTRNTGGSGIGLSSAMAVAKLHAGRITADLHDDRITFLAEIPVRKSNDDPVKKSGFKKLRKRNT